MSEVKKTQPKSVAKARGKARRLAMQAIYQWQMTGDSITDIKQQFVDANAITSAITSSSTSIDGEYFFQLVSGVASSISELDPLLEKNMTRSMESVDPVERAILRLATFEFVNRLDVPYRVVLNEAVNITKEFCSEKSHTFVNAVLDKVAQEIRHVEFKAARL
jgi:N utilization substance protein B